MTAKELLTEDEHAAVALAADLARALTRIPRWGPTRDGDLAELMAAVHTIQNAVLAQAAARAYPDRYRLLGET